MNYYNAMDEELSQWVIGILLLAVIIFGMMWHASEQQSGKTSTAREQEQLLPSSVEPPDPY